MAVIDGRSRRLPLRVEDPQLLNRLRQRECARERLADVVAVRLQFRGRPVTTRGEEYLPGRVVINRRPGSTRSVEVVDLGGSVLLTLVARAGARALPTNLPASVDTLVLPVLIRSAHRCDGHARGDSSQTFLLSVYLRLDDDPVQREIVVPRPGEKVRLLALIDRDCGTA